ncbi:MAG TPA: OmpH family outer membrane protein [Flavobacteriales bacterium]|nr:OmpH family outer membrane protein [Flavobacteriales bacterium]MBK7249020.1 OmpH family outer membrane protein [Flavobacteriales bacterium]QQS71267.1 MAG: OmpH family outer membrane protein [Flavobacteriales bacterium]HQV39422.1 OmpH family outer membrane protein [Flavobacteriales bacterium]HQW32886.1 OmpH family outer membrane protein [Flavobacteriales bacterium]
MRKLIMTLCVMLAASTAMQAQATAKLGHIDRQALMLMLPERKAAETKMQDFAKTLDERLKAMGQEYQDKVTDAQSKAENMTKTEQQVAMREIQELEQRISDAQDKAKEDLSKQENELLAPMIDRTNKAIKDVAAEGHFTYIFDTSTGMVLYSDGGTDILPLVKTKLGIQ